MRRWSTAWLAAVVLGVTLMFSTQAQAKDAQGPGKGIAIIEEHGQWEISYGTVYFRTFGTLQNKRAKPVQFVKMQLDLIDATGKSVFTFIGYNQKAETLGDVEGIGAADAEPRVPLEEKLKKIEPLKPGEKDLFRLGVGKDEIPKSPKFKKYTLKIIEVREAK